MAYEIRTRLNTDDVPSDKQTKYEDWKAQFRTILDNQATDYQTVEPRDDGTRPGYDEFRVYFDIRDDRETILTALEDTFPDVEWFVTHSRRNDTELSISTYRDDPDYYHPDLQTGLLRPPRFYREGSHELVYDDIHVCIDGGEHTIPSGRIFFGEIEDDVSTDYDAVFDRPQGREQYEFYVDADGLNTESGILVSTVEVHPGRIVEIQPESLEQVTEDWGTADILRGDPPEPFVDDDVSFPEPVPMGDRLRDIEVATGKGGPGERGIASRIDDLEDRIAELESK